MPSWHHYFFLENLTMKINPDSNVMRTIVFLVVGTLALVRETSFLTQSVPIGMAGFCILFVAAGVAGIIIYQALLLTDRVLFGNPIS